MNIYICMNYYTGYGRKQRQKEAGKRGCSSSIKSNRREFLLWEFKSSFDNHEEYENDKTLGVAYNYVKNFDFSNGRAYENAICIIRKGIINTTTKKEWMRNNKNTQRNR